MPATKGDGRSERSSRTHENILVAFFDLIGAGALRPRGDDIAAAADVSVRTIFRHFGDMEGLYGAAQSKLDELFDVKIEQPDLEGSLEERARAYATQQGALFESIRNYLLFYISRARTIEEANILRAENVVRQRLRLWSALPECAAATPVARRSVEVLYSFQHWDQLRFEQGLSVEEAIESIAWSAKVLLCAGVRNIDA